MWVYYVFFVWLDAHLHVLGENWVSVMWVTPGFVGRRCSSCFCSSSLVSSIFYCDDHARLIMPVWQLSSHQYFSVHGALYQLDVTSYRLPLCWLCLPSSIWSSCRSSVDCLILGFFRCLWNSTCTGNLILCWFLTVVLFVVFLMCLVDILESSNDVESEKN